MQSRTAVSSNAPPAKLFVLRTWPRALVICGVAVTVAWIALLGFWLGTFIGSLF